MVPDNTIADVVAVLAGVVVVVVRVCVWKVRSASLDRAEACALGSAAFALQPLLRPSHPASKLTWRVLG